MTTTHRRRRVALTIAAGAATISMTGLAASPFIKSPQQLAADTAPPQASVITAAVDQRVLNNTVVTRGRIEADARIEVTPTSIQGASVQVVTAVLVQVGQEVGAGTVLAAVSGRPLFTLPGSLPAYRDLKPGESGADIEQLQIALRDLGHYGGGDKKGYFGAGTKAAVQELYAKLGFEAADTGGPGGRADRQRLADSAKAVEAVQDAVSSMNRRIDAGETAKPGEKPLAEQLIGLKEDLDEAREALADVVAHTGPMVPMSEVVFVPSFPARITGFSAKVGDPVKAPLLIISAGRLGVTVKLRPEQAALVRAGMKASLTSETLGHEAAATVASVGELKVDGETNSNVPTTGNAPYHPLVIHPDEPLPGQWSGQEIRVTIVAARTAGPVLVVPLSAVSAGADGRTMVSVIDSSGATLSVEVRAGVSGNGFVEVTPLAGSLNQGDRVVVGTA